MNGFVYLIGTPTFGWYKIGKSKTPVLRVKNLGVLLPFKIHVIGVWSAKNHTLLEKTLHEIYSPNRINGEWFEFTKQEVQHVFYSIPIEARIFPVETEGHPLDKFSNVVEDTKKCVISNKTRRVIGVRVEKLRGDFTPEERAAKRQAGIDKCRQKKEKREADKQLQEVLTVLP